MQLVSLQSKVSNNARNTPTKSAIEWGNKSISYFELEKYSNQIANFLSINVGENKKIPVVMDKSIDIIVVLIAILKSGNIFVPIDPNYPINRIKMIINEINSEWIIAQYDVLLQISQIVEVNASMTNVLVLDDSEIGNKKLDNLNIVLFDKDINAEYTVSEAITNKHCYIYFTSGSTGKPKGIMGRHKSLSHFIQWEIDEFKVDESYRVSQFTSPAFDPYLRDVLVPLCAGATLCIPANKEIILNPQSMVKWLQEKQITMTHMVPTLFKNITSVLDSGTSLDSLRYILLAGEVLRGNDIRKFVEAFDNSIQIVNLYGPTETTLAKFFHRVENKDLQKTIIPVGKALPYAEALILDEDMNRCPVDAIGEIYIRTPFISSGYFNDREQTKKVFIKNPFGNNPQDIIYKTGDTGRLLQDGNIEVIGRIDNQVKIRGNRIEINEIEALLLKHELVSNAVVDAKEESEGSKYLCAYIVYKDKEAVQKNTFAVELKNYLKQNLPDYMIPTYFLSLDKLPLTQNGKINRRSLPKPQASDFIKEEYVKPSNEIEEKLVDIWKDLLKLEQIGTTNSFFDIGGHSLKAANLLLAISKELNVQLSLKEIFVNPTIKQLADIISNSSSKEYIQIEPIIGQYHYPLSSAQKRVYTLQGFELNNISYNIQQRVNIYGKLDIDKFKNTFVQLTKRHEALRTSFSIVDDEVVQFISEEIKVNIEYEEVSSYNELERISLSFVQAFDLSVAPLMRVKLIKYNESSSSKLEQQYVLLLDIHHIIFDATSIGILIKDFVQLYEGAKLQELRVQYKDYAIWQNKLLESGHMKKQKEYWLSVFNNEIPMLNMPTDYPRPKIQSFEGDTISFELDKQLTQNIKQTIKNTENKDGISTLYMFLLASINVLLSKYSGQEDIVIGSPIAGRTHADLGSIIGMFINTLAMRNYPHGEKTFREFLEEVKENALKAYENQDYQFEELVEALDIQRDMSRNPIFDVMLILQNVEIGELAIKGLRLEQHKTKSNTSKFDITITAVEAENTIRFSLEYSTKLFKKATMEGFINHFVKLLEEITLDSIISLDKRIKDIQFLSLEEKKKVLFDFNDTNISYPNNRTIQDIFEEQVQKTPNSIALICGDVHLSYRELNNKVNQLARLLRAKGVEKECIVALLVKRSVEMMIGILAILKAGGAYLPIDTEYPQERIEYMLEDSGSDIILTTSSTPNKIQSTKPILLIDDKKIYEGDTSSLENKSVDKSLAYVIYTSGSTGKPKGVMIEHKAFINFVEGMAEEIEFKAEKSILALTTICFDIFGLETLLPLLKGMKVIIANEEEQKDVSKISQLLESNNIDMLQATPSRMEMLLTGIDQLALSNIKEILIGGEAFSQDLLAKLHNATTAKVYNVYGPTETTIWSTIKDMSIDKELNIGKPIANTKIYIVDSNNNPQVIGVWGELFIAGLGLARGYLNRPELTEEKFVPNPFATEELSSNKADYQKMYRTGDLARWLSDGNIEFLGRLDKQVKIRGYRIELGEIENKLIKHEAVEKVVVLANKDNSGSKYLCAYIVSEKDPKALELREYLLQELPEYMVPTYFVSIDSLPLTPNGKIDTKKLPNPDGSMEQRAKYQAPRNKTEEKLVEIWESVLGIENIGIKDSFFNLGGHSLKATSMIAKIHKELEVQIPLKEIFLSPTIEGISKYIKTVEKSEYKQVQPIKHSQHDDYTLRSDLTLFSASSAQNRIFALEQFEAQSTSYNMPITLIVEGNLDIQKLAKTFKALIKRHESLRTSFEIIEEGTVQRLHEEVYFDIEHFDDMNIKDKEQIEKTIKSFIRPFKLNEAPLFRVGLIKNITEEQQSTKRQQLTEEDMKNRKITPKQQHLLLLDTHHIISDRASMAILIKEFIAIYEGKELQSLRIQYKDYSVWQRERLNTEGIRKQEEYWLKEFEEEIPVLELPLDYKRPSLQSFEGNSIVIDIDKQLTNKLNQIAQSTGTTMYMILLSALNILLSKYSEQEDIIIGSPISTRHHADLDNIIGMFVNTLAMRNYPQGEKTVKQFLKEVKEKALIAYENREYQFEELIEKLNARKSITRDMSRNPLFDVMFSMENMEIKEQKLKGLNIKSYNQDKKISKFDLTFTAIEVKEKMKLEIEYCTKLFKAETINRMSKHLLNLLEAITSSTDIKLKEIDIISEAEKHQLLNTFNDTHVDFLQQGTIQSVFEAQVKNATQNQYAVISEDKKLTYVELNQKSNQLARLLRQKGVEEDSVVGIMLDKSIYTVISIIAVLKAGGAYLPIDPDYPMDRIVYILKDSKANILLTQDSLKEKVEYKTEIICVDDESIYKGNSENLEHISNSNSLAYVMYTSGTTGKPKGVMIEHTNVLNLCNWMNREYDLQNNKNILQLTNICFDVSIEEIFGTILNGATIFIPNKEIALDKDKFYEYVNKYQISMVQFVPATLRELVAENKFMNSLKVVICGSDRLEKPLKDRILDMGYNLFNCYGPTEITVDALTTKCEKVKETIGKPIANAKAYILDKYKRLKPIGVAGELCIGGAGVARGYLNKQELTNEKFISNPYNNSLEENNTNKLYCTGDLAKWLPDGSIEFLGRIDYQVKIRGYRIELGEIENRMLSHTDIKAGTVIPKKDEYNNKYLCAYIVVDKDIDTEEIRKYLAKELPEYMIPSYFIQLDILPLTYNGKIDRKQLPEPHLDNVIKHNYVAPRSYNEQKLCEAWQEVLRVEKVGIKDNFFTLGGDSIKAIQVASRLKKYRLRLQIKDLLSKPVIEELSKLIQKESKTIEQGIVTGEADLLPIQHWFFENSFTNKHHYNQAVMLHSKEGFKEEIINKVFTKLIIHHDVLRSVYKEEAGKVRQIIRNADSQLFTLEVYDFKGIKDYSQKVKEQAQELQSTIDLENGPLVKLGLFNTEDGDHLLIIIHHLVVDGISWRIIFEDLATGYKQVSEAKEIQFLDKSASYKEWASTLKDYSNNKTLRREIKYWKSIKEQNIQAIKKDNVVKKRLTKHSKVERLSLTREQTEKLLKEANSAYNTEINDLLLTALGVAISKWTNPHKVLINLEGHGRESINNIDISRTIGWFTTMYPVILDMEYRNNTAYQIKVIKEAIRQIPNKGIGYGVLRYLAKQETIKQLEMKKEAEISFNYLGQFDSDINNQMFEMSPLSTGAVSSGEAESTFAIDINGMVAEEQLSFDIKYNSKEYKTDSIVSLATAYKEELLEIIEHCLTVKEREITPSDLGMCKLNINELDVLFNNLKKKNQWQDIKTNIKEIYPLTPMQEGMLFQRIIDKESKAYYEQIALDVEGEINIELYEEGLNRIIEKYEALRTVFVHQDINNPIQIVLKQRKAKLKYEDIREVEADKKEAYVQNIREADKATNFDLTKDVLIRVTVIRLDKESYKIIWSFHHIIMDGWCMGIIMRDFMKIYNALKNNQEIELEEAIPYSRYIKWLEEQDKEEAINYWTKYLEEYEEEAVIPKLSTNNKQEKYKEQKLNITIDETSTNKMKKKAQENQVTINTMLQTIWGIVLQRYNNIEDVVFGAVVSGRPAEIEGIENILGLFINTIPVRINIESEATFSDAVRKIQKEANESKEYEYSTLSEIQSKIAIKQKLINHIMVFENYPIEEEISNIVNRGTLGFRIKDIENIEQTNYDLNIIVMVGKELKINISYNGEVYDSNAINRIGQQISIIINQVIEKPQTFLKDIEILSEQQKQKLLGDFNDTYSNYPKDKTIQQLFEEQSKKNPDAIAVDYEDSQISYRELNNKANQLARVLREKEVKADTIVGIIADRSIEMIIGIIAVLKSGGAYLPIDPNYPKDRISYILKDSQSNILLTQKHINQKFRGEIILLDDSNMYEGDTSNLSPINNSENLAYVMYTSGSTGKPKGNLTNHRSIVRVVKNTNYIELNEKDILLQLSTYAFDGATFDIFGALLNGAKLVMIKKDNILDLNKLSATIIEKEITVFFVTTALFNTLVDTNIECFQKVRKVLFGGEQISVPHAKKALEYLGNGRILHMYGPTESTVYATYHPIDVIDEKLDTIPIGKPISNTEIHILDKYNRLQPIGSIGEICISGDGLVRGYLNRPKLTEEKFVTNPFEKSKKMYKTGDIGRLLQNGSIEFIGRTDSQIKMRGFRIELGEIENQIMKYDDVKEAVVTANQDKESTKYLCAYFTADREVAISEVKSFINKELPKYMIPTYWLQLDKLPLTQNGKIDRKKLSSMLNLENEDNYPQISLDEYEAPRNDIEEKLVKIWQEVLNVDKVGINNDFFELGGHSLKATTLTARIHKEVNVEIPIKEIFNKPTIKELYDYIKNKETNIYTEIKEIQEAYYGDNYYQISSAQKRLYTIQQIDIQSTAYNIPAVLQIEGELDINKLKKVFNKLIQRHEAFRTSFELIEEEILQKIHENIELEVEILDSSSFVSIDKTIKSFIKPFDLSKAPLLRIGLVEIKNSNEQQHIPLAESMKNRKVLPKQQHMLLLDLHHIISDGVSMSILIEEFMKLYEGEEIPSLKLQYKDYALWQNSLRDKEEMETQQDYWLQEFSEEVPVLKLPTDYTRPAVQSFKGDILRSELDRGITKGLNKIAKETGTTLFMVLLASYNVLLSKYTMQEDIVVGTPIAGRPHADLSNIIGMFVNTLAIRSNPQIEKTFLQFLKDVKTKCLSAYENQSLQFEELVEKLDIERDISRNPLFDTMFILQNMNKASNKLSSISVTPYKLDTNISKLDLTVTATETAGKIVLNFTYCTALFKKETIERLSKSFETVIKSLLNNISIKLSEIEILSKEEQNQILVNFNNTKVEYPKSKTLQELFEKQAQSNPNNIAVVCDNKNLNYSELNEKSNQIARLLLNKGLKQGDIAGLMLEPSIETMVGILGVLKAGCAYIPIDFEAPQDRIQYMLQDSNAKIILTQSWHKNKFSNDIEIIQLDNEDIYQQSNSNNKLDNKPDLAYIIYTSGSTGKPKGVQISHKSLVNYVTWFGNKANIGTKDKTILLSSYAFDLGYTSMYSSLVKGAELHIVSKDLYMNPEALMTYMYKNNISYIKLTPSLFNIISNYKGDITIEKLNKLNLVVLGGEQINAIDVAKVYKSNKAIRIMNHYGPTETTIGTIAHIINRNEIEEYIKQPVIGKPISNNKAYILDKNLNPVAIGVIGELYIEGEGLSKGYINRPDLTEQRFKNNPFESDSKIYQTGDLARWLPNGSIKFIGRVDYQVKINGYRVELGEIENKLIQHEAINEAIVIAREDNTSRKYLCAYMTTKEKLTVTELREFLSKDLPSYMIPSYFIELENLPLTPNGKIDRRSLADTEKYPHYNELISTGEEYESPRNYIEEILVDVWKEVLGSNQIGINDNFFALGGDSIKAIQVASRLQKHQLRLEVRYLLHNPKIKELSKHVQKSSRKAEQKIITGEIQLTPIQKWFFEANIINQHHWNQAVMLYRKEGFDGQVLAKAFDKLVEQHDVLRAVYEQRTEGIVQCNRGVEGELYSLKQYDLTKKDNYEEIIKEEANILQATINIENGPLVKLGLFKSPIGDHLLIAIHHLVIDGVSWRIIFEDLAIAYNQILKNEEIVLQEKTDSFKLWSEKLLKYANSKVLLDEIEYWTNIESTETKPLPKDTKSEESLMKDIKTVSVSLNEQYTQKLLKETSRAYNTEINDILLTALGITIKNWIDHDKVLISLEGHGRDLSLGDLDITRTVGWFTSKHPVLLNMTSKSSSCITIHEQEEISNYIKIVKETLRQIPNKGIGYGILKYITTEENKKELDFKKEPEILFNYLGQFDSDVNTENFAISNIPTGNTISLESESFYSIIVGGMVAGGKLGLSFDYRSNEYKKETIQSFAKNYLDNITKTINHCISKEEVELTPSDFSSKAINLKEFETIKEVLRNSNIDVCEIQDVYFLSPMQEGILFHKLIDEESITYFQQTTLSIDGEVDTKLFEHCFNKMLEKYDVLRTIFVYEEVKKPVQVVLKQRKATIQNIDITEMTQENQVAYIEKYTEEDKKKGFKLNIDIPMRIAIIKTSEQNYKIIWSYHHIIMDGWCHGIIMQDFFKNYIVFKEQKSTKVEKQKPLATNKPYAKYIQWMEQQNKEEAKAYWANYLHGYEEQAVIPFANNVTKIVKYKNQAVELIIDEANTNTLKEHSKKIGVTLNTLLQTIWGILLQKYNRTEDVVFGAVVSGRPAEIEDVEKMIGLFINTIPVRINCNGEKTFREEAIMVQNRAGESTKYDYLPLAEIQGTSSLKQKLINHVLVFDNYPVEQQVEEMASENKLGFDISSVEAFEQTSYNLNVKLTPAKELSIKLSYNSEVYTEENISNILKNLKNIINGVLKNREVKIKDLEIIDEKEKQQILKDFNDTQVEYPNNTTLSALFEEQVTKNPNRTAVIMENDEMELETLTYKELNEKSNRLAREIRSKGIKQDSIVGIMVERSFEMIIGIFAILKAGGAYLPIDPEYPADRINYMLEDSEAVLLLTKSKYLSKVKFEKVIDLEEEITETDVSNLEPLSKANNLAYIIYTSGSTGKPKGTMIEHHSIINRIKWMQKQYPINSEDVILQKTTYTFDVSVWELLWWSTEGAKVCLLRVGGEKEPNIIVKTIEKAKVSVMHFVPSMLNVFLQYLEAEVDTSRLKSLKQVFASGEALTLKQVESFNSKINKHYGTKLANLYGPTEASVDVSYFDCSTGEELKKIPIGRPIDNIKLYIVDKYNNLQPIGVAGELCISGVGLARGYLNMPELTAEKFIDNPFQLGEKMYRTGDLAKWMADGNIEYIGRIDHQVKVRGFRIELGEIQNVLKEQEEVKEAIVLVKGKGNSENNYLCAYLVGENIDIEAIKENIKKKLTDYMIPNTFIILDKLPLTANGKADTKALLSIQRQDDNREKILPVSYFDSTIADIWKEILDVEEVYVNDDFFELGGNSINIIQVANAIKKSLEVEVTPADLMAYKTIAELSEYMTDKDNDTRGLFKNAFKLNKSKSTKNIFIIHGGDANIFYYRYLANLLEDEYSVYGLQPKGLNGEEPLPISYYEMLYDYIKEIRIIQPEGPYIIGGYCIGGYLAFDIVKIMEIQGDKVSAMLQLDEEAFIEEGWDKVIRKNTTLFKSIDKWRKVTRKDKLYTQQKHMDYFLKPEPVSKEEQLELLKDKKALQHHFQRVIPKGSKYINIGYYVKSPTLVIKAEGNNHKLFKKELWEKMVKGSLEYYEIPGEHLTVLLPPYVEKMAKVIREYLSRICK